MGKAAADAGIRTRFNYALRLSVHLRDAPLVDELASIWAANAGTVHPAGYRAMAHSMAEADLRDVLPRIQVPTPLLYGSFSMSPGNAGLLGDAGLPALDQPEGDVGRPWWHAGRGRQAFEDRADVVAELDEVGVSGDVEPGPEFRRRGAAEQTHESALDAPHTFKGCLGALGDGRSPYRGSPPASVLPAGLGGSVLQVTHLGPPPAAAELGSHNPPAVPGEQQPGYTDSDEVPGIVAVPASNQPLRQDNAGGRWGLEHVCSGEQAGDADGEQQQAEQGEADAVAAVHLGYPFQAADADTDLAAVGADKLVKHLGCVLLDGGLGGAGDVGVQAHP